MRKILSVAILAMLAFTACNYTDGPCYYRDDVAGNDGVGGHITPGGAGGFGDVPPEPQDATDQEAPECNAIGSYSASLFKFTTTLADDGLNEAGGYQEASATVKFVDGRQEPPTSWSCTLNVGMAVRSTSFGKISAQDAANYTADVLTAAAGITMSSRPSWIKALFCIKLKESMLKVFALEEYKGLGARVTAQ